MSLGAETLSQFNYYPLEKLLQILENSSKQRALRLHNKIVKVGTLPIFGLFAYFVNFI